ncbi:1817_t:CDS:2, partial [Cetraspora pellucida]
MEYAPGNNNNNALGITIIITTKWQNSAWTPKVRREGLSANLTSCSSRGLLPVSCLFLYFSANDLLLLIGFTRDEVVIIYSDETKRFFNFQIVESSEDMIDLKSETANKLDMVLEVSEVLSQENDKYKVKFDELKVLLNEDEIEQNLDDDNNQNSEKENSEKSNNKEEDANMIENDYKEEVDEMYKGKMDYEAEEKVDEMYREDIKEADQIDR